MFFLFDTFGVKNLDCTAFDCGEGATEKEGCYGVGSSPRGPGREDCRGGAAGGGRSGI